jgi:hypothetical protein
MNWKKASRQQLLQILLHEPCPSAFKFIAANEFKKRDKKAFNKFLKQAKMVRHKD